MSHKLVTFVPAEAGTQFCSIAGGYFVPWMPAFAGTNGEWVRHVAQTRYVHPRGSGDPVLLNCRRVLRSLDARFRGHERRMGEACRTNSLRSSPRKRGPSSAQLPTGTSFPGCPLSRARTENGEATSWPG